MHSKNEADHEATEAMLSTFVDLANRNNALMDGTTEAVKAIMDGADVVAAVWQDSAAPNGVGYLIVKGQQQLREIMSSGKSKDIAVNAIKCVERDQAHALLQVFGERDVLH